MKNPSSDTIYTWDCGTTTLKSLTGRISPSTPYFYHNPDRVPRQLVLPFQPVPQTLYIPPTATLLSTPITPSLPLTQTIFPHFNLITLDPPWPNRSVRRSSSYSTASTHNFITTLLYSLPIHTHLLPNGLLGIWITNKPTFRSLVLGPNGCFARWGVQLVEEWVWLKVTVDGRPVTELGGVWRKPYEIFLLGRKVQEEDVVRDGSGEGSGTEPVKRRVIVGVPDLHSRKPCLKALLEEMVPEQYEALEIFARYGMAGWWAWGDEVGKFLGEEWWVDVDVEEEGVGGDGDTSHDDDDEDEDERGVQ